MDELAPDAKATADPPGHEPSVVDTASVAWFSFGLVVMGIVSAIVAFALLDGFRPPRPATFQLPPQSTAPDANAVLQAAPATDLNDFRRDKADALLGYRWIDKQAGWVGIPIERAMQLTAERAARRGPAPDASGTAR